MLRRKNIILYFHYKNISFEKIKRLVFFIHHTLLSLVFFGLRQTRWISYQPSLKLPLIIFFSTFRYQLYIFIILRKIVIEKN